MRSALLRSVVLITLAAMLGGHVTELFDHWDHTLRTGKDADYTIVLAAACAGFAFVVAKRLASLFRQPRQSENFLPKPSFSIPIFRTITAATSVAGPSPPPLVPLRI